MTVKDMYEKVMLKKNVDIRSFINALNDTQDEVSSSYRVGTPDKILRLEDEISIDVLFHNAMLDNVLFILGAGDSFKSEFLRKCHEAYKVLVGSKSKRRTLRRSGW